MHSRLDGILHLVQKLLAPNDYDSDETPLFDTKVQSYGQLVKQGLKSKFPVPGIACNPNTPPPAEEH